jgi:hypothetical protein
MYVGLARAVLVLGPSQLLNRRVIECTGPTCVCILLVSRGMPASHQETVGLGGG